MFHRYGSTFRLSFQLSTIVDRHSLSTHHQPPWLVIKHHSAAGRACRAERNTCSGTCVGVARTGKSLTLGWLVAWLVAMLPWLLRIVRIVRIVGAEVEHSQAGTDLLPRLAQAYGSLEECSSAVPRGGSPARQGRCVRRRLKSIKMYKTYMSLCCYPLSVYFKYVNHFNIRVMVLAILSGVCWVMTW